MSTTDYDFPKPELTGDRALVFPADAGDFERGFREAEKAIYGGALIESLPSQSSFLANTLRSGLWLSLLAVGVSLCLIAGQNAYLHRRPMSGREATAAILGGLFAGAIGGTAGQALFTFAAAVSNLPGLGATATWLLLPLGRIISWAVLGALLAAGLAMFVPNLPSGRACIAGGIGGAAAAVVFLIASLLGDAAGRLLGALILGGAIGMMIALVEAAVRTEWLEIRYGVREVVRVNLGSTPVTIGSARSCTVYAPHVRPLALQYSVNDGTITCLDYSTETVSEIVSGDEKQVGNVTVTLCVSLAEAFDANTVKSSPAIASIPKAPPPPRRKKISPTTALPVPQPSEGNTPPRAAAECEDAENRSLRTASSDAGASHPNPTRLPPPPPPRRKRS